MRVLTALLAVTLAAPLIAATAASPSNATPGAAPDSECSRTTSYLAGQTGNYRGRPLMPKKLTELPPAIPYMAVHRHIGSCEAPLTMVEYRNPRRH